MADELVRFSTALENSRCVPCAIALKAIDEDIRP